jgi:hypothetical protein
MLVSNPEHLNQIGCHSNVSRIVCVRAVRFGAPALKGRFPYFAWSYCRLCFFGFGSGVVYF